MIWVAVVGGAMLAVGAILALVRVEKGPSILDRMVGLDVITSVLVIGVAMEAAFRRRTDTLSILGALSLVGFVASVAVARFSSVEPEDAGRIKTPAEIQAEEEAIARQEEEEALREAEMAASREDEV